MNQKGILLQRFAIYNFAAPGRNFRFGFFFIYKMLGPLVIKSFVVMLQGANFIWAPGLVKFFLAGIT